ncbi:uncharacterized protein TrAFT101_001474 [Trichoderma asperellum]|uniref:uncharacterized protein n=1 Tax=Trichoderma asperellum TaxID=101201 RepID=UPI003321ED70|nr:hypothetical protein TrAFT101_001474 [Trichoderma asperellum]
MENHPAAGLLQGPEYFSRNGQQLVLGATSSPEPKPGHLRWHVTTFIQFRHIVIQPHWSFWQPICASMAVCSAEWSTRAYY